MDRYEEALWTQVRSLFPDRAEIVKADEHGFVVSWLADDEPMRPHLRAQGVLLRVDKPLRVAIRAANRIELERIAVNASRLVQTAMHDYADDRETGQPFVIDLAQSLAAR